MTKALDNISGVIVDPNWKIKEKGEEIPGIEHSGLHMILQKILLHDEASVKTGNATLSELIVKKLSKDIVSYLIMLIVI